MKTGIVKSYVKEKGYGFIQAEHNSVFFHINDVTAKDKNKITVGSVVNYEESPNRKGNKAINVKIANQNNLTYGIPDGPFILKKGDKLRDGLVLLEISNYEIFFTLRNPSISKEMFAEKLRQIGANAVVDVTVTQGTGEEPGTGSGTHYFTVHHFTGRIATVGRISSFGKPIYEIPSVNDRLKEKEEELKIKQEAKLKKVNKICRYTSAAVLIISLAVTLIALNMTLEYGLGSSILFTIFVHYTLFINLYSTRDDTFNSIRVYDEFIKVGDYQIHKKKLIL